MRTTRRWPVAFAALAALPTLAATCVQGEFERDPDALPRPLPLATKFVADGVNREVVALSGITYQFDARTRIAAHSHSVNLWMVRSRGTGSFEPGVFLGAVPSCLGRSLMRDGSDGVSACYLAAFRLESEDRVAVKMYLGGGWSTTLELPLGPAFTDSDQDGTNDALEALLFTNPHSNDTDEDGEMDAEDPNPLVAPAPQPMAQPQLDTWSLTRIATEDLLNCRRGKPYFIIGPAAARQSLPARPCQMYYLDEGSPQAYQRGLLLPVKGRPTSGEAVVREAALTGGIPRVRVTVGPVTAKEATVSLLLQGGTVRKTFQRVVNPDSPRQSEWRLIGREIELIGSGADLAAEGPAPAPP